jgi:hypothetical protein
MDMRGFDSLTAYEQSRRPVCLGMQYDDVNEALDKICNEKKFFDNIRERAKKQMAYLSGDL